jgi:hypothetical protein
MCTLNIGTWNMRGALYGASYLNNLINEVDVLVLCEHWLDTSNVDILHTINSRYKVTYKVRKSVTGSTYLRGAGGLAIFSKRGVDIKVKPLPLDSDYIIGVSLQIKGLHDIFIVGALLPSTNVCHNVFMDALCDLFDVYDTYAEQGPTLICGDLNADIVRNSYIRDYELFSYISERDLCHSVTLSGRQGPPYTYRNKEKTHVSLIDYILVPGYLRDSVTFCKVYNDCHFDVSDHYPVTVSITYDLLYAQHALYASQHLKWSKADDVELRMFSTEVNMILNADWNLDTSELSIEQHSEHISRTLLAAANRSIPKGQYRSYLKPYWKTHGLDALHYDMRKSRRAWKHQQKPRGDNPAYAAYKETTRIFRKNMRNAKRDGDSNRFSELDSAADVDIGYFYKVVKQQRRKQDTVEEMVYKGKSERSNVGICNLLGSYYYDLFSPQENCNFDGEFKLYVENSISDIEDCSFNDDCEILTECVTVSEIKDQVAKLKIGKAPGPDCITNEHIRLAGEKLYTHLAVLFNNVITQEYLPIAYRSGHVILMYKRNSKDKRDPSNYRGITLTSCLGKLLEKIILNRIQTCLNQANVQFPHELQFGFRTAYGATPAAYMLNECISYFVNNGSPVYASFLDNAKAFDKIWHDGLLYKLYKLGVQGKVWRIIAHSYKCFNVRVQWHGCYSDPIPVKQGVGQGRVLSAWMFLVFINDLVCELDSLGYGIKIGGTHFPGILLADDTTLLCPTNRALQCELDCVNSYAQRWRLTYNASKSHVLEFFPTKDRTRARTSEYKLGDTVVEVCENVIYAGTVISTVHQTKTAVNRMCKKSRQSMCALHDLGISGNGMNPLSSTKIWLRVILPSALYGCEVIGNISVTLLEKLERVQRLFARKVQNLHRSSHRCSTIQLLGLWSVEGYINKCKLLFFGRLLQASSNMAYKKLFLFLLARYVNGISIGSCITDDLFNILHQYGLSHFLQQYLDGSTVDKLAWRHIVRQSVSAAENQTWSRITLETRGMHLFTYIQPVLRPHTLWRLCFIYKNYLHELGFLVQLGACGVIKSECTVCKSHVTDIVRHTILQCPSLCNDRNTLMSEVVNALNVQTSVDFFNMSDDEILASLLGGYTRALSTLSDYEWGDFIVKIACILYRWREHVPPLCTY